VEHRLKVFEHKMLRGIFGSEGGEEEDGYSYMIRSFIVWTLH